MKSWIRCVALAGLASIAAEPALAAPLGGDGGLAPAHVAAFAGASMVLRFGSGGHARASARLELSPIASFYDAGSGRLLQRRGAGLELGLTRAGKPDLRLAGYAPADLKHRLGFKGSTGYIVVGGAVLVVFLLAAVANASPKPGPRPGDFGG